MGVGGTACLTQASHSSPGQWGGSLRKAAYLCPPASLGTKKTRPSTERAQIFTGGESVPGDPRWNAEPLRAQLREILKTPESTCFCLHPEGNDLRKLWDQSCEISRLSGRLVEWKVFYIVSPINHHWLRLPRWKTVGKNRFLPRWKKWYVNDFARKLIWTNPKYRLME